MGLLDDAIREHLELKKRRGADTTEVARQEQEAFGPPRRGESDSASATAQAVAEHEDNGHGHESAGDVESEAPTALHAVEDSPHLQDEPPRFHGDPADALPHADDEAAEHPPAADEPAVDQDALVPDPGQPTRAFDAHEVRAAAGVEPVQEPVREPEPEPEAAPEPPPTPAPRAAEEEEEPDEDADVLEETPEFLQETPEHDRLWFEQRPPRDFDF